MNDVDQPKLDELEAERALLEAFRQRWQAKGLNLDHGLISWAQAEAKALESWSVGRTSMNCALTDVGQRFWLS